jgi:predicted ABC-type transport system involved in lysophospholipase L1 biosynthesis ATPase subunit
LEPVGLGDRMTHCPLEMSGSERRRIAAARAPVNRPVIVMADR